MKKFAIFFIFVLFAVFVYLGFQAASNIKANSSGGSLPANAPTALASAQQNILLIHVDDLTSSKPNLISAWGAFIYYTDPNQIIFLPLLPSYNTAVQSAIESEFSLDKTRQVSSRFVSLLRQEFDIKVTGVVVTDNQGLTYFNNQLAGQAAPIAAAAPENDDQKHRILLNGQSFFQTICTSVQNHSADAYTSIQWNQVIPDHFITTIPFETIMVDFQKVFQNSGANQCYVLSNE